MGFYWILNRLCQTGWRLRQEIILRDILGSMEAVLVLKISGPSQPSCQITRNRLRPTKIGILFNLLMILCKAFWLWSQISIPIFWAYYLGLVIRNILKPLLS